MLFPTVWPSGSAWISTITLQPSRIFDSDWLTDSLYLYCNCEVDKNFIKLYFYWSCWRVLQPTTTKEAEKNTKTIRRRCSPINMTNNRALTWLMMDYMLGQGGVSWVIEVINPLTLTLLFRTVTYYLLQICRLCWLYPLSTLLNSSRVNHSDLFLF